MELILPSRDAGQPRSRRRGGADAVYCGFRDETNARNFPGLSFSREELRKGIAFAHRHGVKVLVAINTFARAGSFPLWQAAVDDAAAAGADALILADLATLDYARAAIEQKLHVSVQAGAANPDAIRFYAEAFERAASVLPRVLNVMEIATIVRESACETEVFVFGGLCVMEEGRCSLSSYATGQSPNMNGVCSPASHVAYTEHDGRISSTLGGFTINSFGKNELAGYPTLCKGRFATPKGSGYIFEEPVSLDAAVMLPALRDAGVTALKIEGRQRGRAYIAEVVRSFRDILSGLDQ